MTRNPLLDAFREARRTKTAYICEECRDANRRRDTHPGLMHKPGICDCVCLDPQRH